MAHDFLNKMLENSADHFQAQLLGCLIGGFLLVNAYLADIIFIKMELGSLLALLSALLLGLPLVYHALKDLLTGQPEMNELAALSFIASFTSGSYQAAAFIAFFMFITQLIEHRAQLGARKNIEALIRLSPQKASVERPDGCAEISATSLAIDDIVRVKPGESIPGDGTVIEGSSSVNEATITGESIPVEKQTDSRVYTGTINLTGFLRVKITSAPEDSTLAKIQEMIVQAQDSKTPVMRLIHRYVAWYTPVIIMLTGIVLFFTHDINRAISMLIIACPCTILLSQPTALVAALSAAARLGVVIKSLSTLEIANRIKSLVFDKTGTLTSGNLRVSAITPLADITEEQLLLFGASAEQFSNHPAAKALVHEADKRGLALRPAQNFREEPGRGVVAEIEGLKTAVGRQQWITENCVHPSGLFPGDGDSSFLYISRDNRVLGYIELSDALKEDAPAVIDDLLQNDIEQIIMLTGDRKTVAEKTAARLGCSVEAEVLPEQKMTKVNQLKKSGYTVAVVGDGVNDAPALAAGDVSIAMGAVGSDVAIHSANIVLMNDQLNRIPFIIQLSHRTVAIIRQNLAFSLIFIATMLVLSASGLIAPVLSVLMHTFSSLFVVFNSARLLRVGETLS